MTSYDNMQGYEQDADDHPDNSHNYTRMAGDVVPIDFSASGGNYQKTGPAAASDKENAIKINIAPSTGNVIGIGNRKVIK